MNGRSKVANFSAGFYLWSILLLGGIGIWALINADWVIALVMIAGAIAIVPFYIYQRRRGL